MIEKEKASQKTYIFLTLQTIQHKNPYIYLSLQKNILFGTVEELRKIAALELLMIGDSQGPAIIRL
jgi:hypothetical protein